ncbi:oxygenase MpaB family protein [Nocardia sp. NRRL WC-3656]|uniref:oxygenase MpaB family protein n=1 Tax=Nocardia sp. NRRL WC-3656 TaxID=1463824 RepID=UPI0004C2B80B|nr:oxygenase MpaB family protein [Nocardia sp. NRRL WC-3656]
MTTQIRTLKCPSAFRYWEAKQQPAVQRLEAIVRKVTGAELFPTDEQARALTEDLFAGDPVAERFVAEVMHGPGGSAEGRALLDRALAEGIDAVPEAPDSMRELFAEFDTVPEWVRPELVEQGAAIWRRWGTMLFSFAGAETLEMYTESAVATPLSLAGGYAGNSALRRYLETCRFWMDVSQPNALLTPGSTGRATALKVRVMHVSVRARVAGHPEWDIDKWGLPISQTYQLLTLIAGSVTPGLGLWALGYQTTPSEIRALLHFQKYMGYLLGVRLQWHPETVVDSLRVLAMTIASRSYDAGAHGAELIESYPAAFAPRPEHRGVSRLRAAYNYRINSVYSAMYMAPGTRRKYRMPPAFPWLLIPVLRFPLITAMEFVRRIPPVGRVHEKVMVRHRENWYRAQMQGREAEFDASGALRR